MDKYVKQLDKAVSLQQRAIPASDLYSFRMTKNYFSIFEKNVDKIGVLAHPLPKQIVEFYVRAFAIVEDIETVMELKKAGRDVPTERALQGYTELLKMFEESKALGKQIAKDLKMKYFPREQEKNMQDEPANESEAT